MSKAKVIKLQDYKNKDKDKNSKDEEWTALEMTKEILKDFKNKEIEGTKGFAFILQDLSNSKVDFSFWWYQAGMNSREIIGMLEHVKASLIRKTYVEEED